MKPKSILRLSLAFSMILILALACKEKGDDKKSDSSPQTQTMGTQKTDDVLPPDNSSPEAKISKTDQNSMQEVKKSSSGSNPGTSINLDEMKNKSKTCLSSLLSADDMKTIKDLVESKDEDIAAFRAKIQEILKAESTKKAIEDFRSCMADVKKEILDKRPIKKVLKDLEPLKRLVDEAVKDTDADMDEIHAKLEQALKNGSIATSDIYKVIDEVLKDLPVNLDDIHAKIDELLKVGASDLESIHKDIDSILTGGAVDLETIHKDIDELLGALLKGDIFDAIRAKIDIFLKPWKDGIADIHAKIGDPGKGPGDPDFHDKLSEIIKGGGKDAGEIDAAIDEFLKEIGDGSLIKILSSVDELEKLRKEVMDIDGLDELRKLIEDLLKV
ncbi:MAG: hypothetical protein HQK54_15260 [Oligoflexales bacterium]|nr:hypothetical protein [Oligoflexales bacterium]